MEKHEELNDRIADLSKRSDSRFQDAVEFRADITDLRKTIAAIKEALSKGGYISTPKERLRSEFVESGRITT